MTNLNQILKLEQLKHSILKIHLNRPEALNALNQDVLKKLLEVFSQVKQDDSIKAILITGEGKAFCAGADIKQLVDLTAQTGLAFARNGQKVFRALEQLGKPSLAAIHGAALGGGCELIMSATLRIATENAIFGQPEIKLGVIPGFGGTQRLARLIGKGRALDLCITGRTIKAAEALQWGLINEIVPAEELISRAQQILENLIKFSPIALQSVMNTIDGGYDLSLTDACELEAVNFGICCASKDKKEGVSAFLEKRTAIFSGE